MITKTKNTTQMLLLQQQLALHQGYLIKTPESFVILGSEGVRHSRWYHRFRIKEIQAEILNQKKQ